MQLLTSTFLHPDIEVLPQHLVDHFSSDYAKKRRPLRNPHLETPVSRSVKAAATESAVLIVFVKEAGQLKVIVTKRSAKIRFGGHICFPGGKVDNGDHNPEATALREAEEEIGLDPEKVTVLGTMGEYFTQSGYRITPVVGIVQQPISIEHDLNALDDEVEAIYTVPAKLLFASNAYALHRFNTAPAFSRGHYSLSYQDLRIAGPTVSLMMGLYEELLKSQGLIECHNDNQANI